MGFLYNEFYAIPMYAGDSKWGPPADGSEFYVKISNSTFPFGVDPIWKQVRTDMEHARTPSS